MVISVYSSEILPTLQPISSIAITIRYCTKQNMSKHRIKNIVLEDDFDDDKEEDYIQTEEMTAEDQEQLRVGAIQVRSALGQAFASIADKEIQDTLWHYYYDVAKSVSYLKSMLLGEHLRNDF